MRTKLLFFLSIVLVFVFSCGPLTLPDSAVGEPAQKPSGPQSAKAGGFSAEAISSGSVQFTWEPVAGANLYRLEVLAGEEEFLPLAELPGDQRAYELKFAPPSSEFTFRWSAEGGGQVAEQQILTLSTPSIEADPLTVTLEYDTTPGLFDPANFDPSTFDPSLIDPENPDLSMFLPQPIAASAVIGSQGGEISVTGSNGIAYTLLVPAGALDFDVPISLRPVLDIPDLPVSGGLVGAVFIEPEGLSFNLPATLRMVAPEGAPEPGGEVLMAFGFEEHGSEFHLRPVLGASVQARSGGRLASPPPAPQAVGPLTDEKIWGPGGMARAYAEKVEADALRQRSPSTARAQAEQQSALDQLAEELAPLPNLAPEAASFALHGQSLLLRLANVPDSTEFMDLMLEVHGYLESGGKEYNKSLNGKLLDLLAERAHELLTRAGAACLTQDALMAQVLAKLLRTPDGSGAYQEVASRMQQKHGDKALKDVEEIGKECSYGLEMKSTLSFEAEGSTLFSSAEVERIPLHPSFGNGRVRLWGGYDMRLKHSVSGTCSFPLQQYDTLWLEVGMDLVFRNGELVDIDLNEYTVHGWTAAAGAHGASEEECPVSVRVIGGGDYWTGLFMVSRQVNGGFSLLGWKIQADDPEYIKNMTATWESVVPSFPAPGGGTMSEDSKFKLVVKKNN